MSLTYHLNRLADTLDANDIPTLDACGAANVYAGTSGLDLVGALNVAAGNTAPNYLSLDGVMNQIAGTTGLSANAASALIIASSLGTVTDTGAGVAPTNWDSARTLTIETPEIPTADATVTISLRNMTGANGLVFFHSGSHLPAWWDDGTDANMNTFMNSLVSAGLRLVQVRGDTNYWMNAPSNDKLGSVIVAKRPAALIKYIHDTYSDGLSFHVIGGSAGSSALGYAYVFHGLGSIIDTALHTSSVPHADIYKACNRLAGEEEYWSTQPAGFDIAHGYAGVGTDPCAVGDESVEGELWSSTSLISGANSDYAAPGMRVILLTGSDDTNFMAQAVAYHDRLVSAGKSHQFGYVPQVGHGLKDTDMGRFTIRNALAGDPFISQWVAGSAVSTTVSVTLDEAPEAGDLLVAIRKWGGSSGNGLTPSGWTRGRSASVAATGRTCAMELKVADGTEGTTFNFGATSSNAQIVTLCTVKNLSGTIGENIGQSVTGTGSSISLSATSTDASAIGFTAVVVEGTGANTFGEAWSGEYRQLSDSGGNFSIGFAPHASASLKSTSETWSEAGKAYAGFITILSGT